MLHHLHHLTVTQIHRETPDAVSLLFDIPKALKSHFAFQPGQYLTLEAEITGERVRRAYSICSGLDDDEIRVAVKEIEGGRFSTFVNRLLKPGDVLGVMEPRGRFVLPPSPKEGRTLLAAVAGSGITPVLSMARAVLIREPCSRFVLLFGNKRHCDILFRAQITDLQKQFFPRLMVRHILSRENVGPEFGHGRIDGGRLIDILSELEIPMPQVDHALICGPPQMVANLRAALQQHGVKAHKILFESFSSDTATTFRNEILPDEPARQRQVELRLDRRSTMIETHPGETIVAAARRQGVDVPFSCGAGTCCSCVAKIVEGSVAIESDTALEAWEREAGFVLTCQSRPTSDRVVVDYDAAL